jgi:hypothetical protein
MDDYNIFRVSNSVTINWVIFILVTLITLAEFYKIYVNIFCGPHEYTIRKVISTNNDLNLPENSKQYEENVPRLVIYKHEDLFNQKTKLLSIAPLLQSEESMMKKTF